MLAFYTERDVISMLDIKDTFDAIAAGELTGCDAMTIHGVRLWSAETIDKLKEDKKCKTKT